MTYLCSIFFIFVASVDPLSKNKSRIIIQKCLKFCKQLTLLGRTVQQLPFFKTVRLYTVRKKKINKNSLSFICCHVWSKTGHYSSDCQNNTKKEGNLARYLEKPLSETRLISVPGEVNRRKIILMFVKRHLFIRPLKDWGRTMCCECPSLSVCRRNGLRVIRIVIDDKGNNKITELRTILQRESQNS
jgi:hypothetical protein